MSDMDGGIPTVGIDTGDTMTVWPASGNELSGQGGFSIGGGSWSDLDNAQKEWLAAKEREKAAAEANAKAEADAKRLAEESARAKTEATARAKADEEAKHRHVEEGKKISVTSAEAKVRQATNNINNAQKILNDRKRQRDALVKPRDDLKKSLTSQEELLGLDWSLLGLVEDTDAKLHQAQLALDAATRAVNDAENSLETAKREKEYADITLNTARDKQRQAEAEAARLATARKQAEEEAARKATLQKQAEEIARKQAEALKRAEEEKRQKEIVLQKAREEAARVGKLMSQAGVKPVPIYTAEMTTAGNRALNAAGSLVLNRAPGVMQFSLPGKGVLTLGGEAVGMLGTAISRIAATVAKGLPGGFVLATIFHSPKAGVGSDIVPGRDTEAMFALNAKLLVGDGVRIDAGMKSVEIPVRGALVNLNDSPTLALMKTGDGLSKTVPVLDVVRDETTGLDYITVPAVAGAPSRTILINPVPMSQQLSHTGNTKPAPVTPVHTGSEVRVVSNIVTTTTPLTDSHGLRDFIYWQPDVQGSGVEPVYVMLSGPYGETNAKGKYSGRDYNPDRAGGPIQNLDWKTAAIDRAGVDKIKLHTGRFGESPENKVMIERLEKILKDELAVTDTDKRFYTHEIRELERYRNLGIKDGEVPQSVLEQKTVWNNTHTATLEDYKINEKEHALYTDEALQAAYEQEFKDALGGKK